VNEQLARLREWYEKLAPRERKLMTALLGFLGVFLLVLVPLIVSLMLGSRRQENKAHRRGDLRHQEFSRRGSPAAGQA